MIKTHQKPFIQEIKEDWILDKGLQLFIKREDVIHPTVSGNKWRKLKYNLKQAKAEGHDTLLTFGGAYSNHIYATAAAAQEDGLKAIGVIRGQELANKPLNATLTFAKKCGMQLHFITRTEYRQKTEDEHLEKLKERFGRFYLIPEGGTNNLAIKGSGEIVDESVKGFDIVCLPVGTGGTMSGVIAAVEQNQMVIGFSVLKGDFLKKEVKDLLRRYFESDLHRPRTESSQAVCSWHIETTYHFGGYAKSNQELLNFITEFEGNHEIPLDPIYTGKMMYGLFEKIKKGDFKNGTKILAIHTGGLQGRTSE